MKSSKDLIDAALSGEVPERVPVAVVSSAWVFSTYDLDLSLTYENADQMTKAWRTFDREFGADAVVPSLSSTVIPSYFGTTWKFPKRGFPMLLEPAVKDVSELDSLTWDDILEDQHVRAATEHVKQLVEQFGNERCIWFMTTGPLSNAARIVETQFLMECFIEDPEFVRSLFRLSMESFKAVTEPVLELGVDVMDFSSSPGSPDLISPRMYREFFWEFDRELVQWIQSKGARAVFHICGDTMRIVENMKDTGADGLSVDSMLNLSTARDVIGRTALVGNLDPANVLMNGTPSMVREESMKAMRTGGLDGAFVLAPGCDVPPTCPKDNILAMIQAAKQDGIYPLEP
ncbi:MAG: uroporphyrinogen decarboxylase family protein [Promethearchaeota archaeon]